ncbi:hypothetical protein [Parafrankia discariae]|uniref:hypothetical protein n=1 Tax=Parafrankia discariae TaxID=365528 RepID=UPI000368C0C4|nr:hypothetical protein [Parafrankia discariae]
MPDTPPPDTPPSDTPTPGAVTFAGSLVPALESGDYRIRVRQETDLDNQTYSTGRTFTVAGERFGLPPTAVVSTYPPNGGLGEYDETLPHVVLNRATLPWERSPSSTGTETDGGSAPWLALLVFAGDERPEPRTVTLGTLATSPAHIPAPVLERHQSEADPVTVIDVDTKVLADLIPAYDELPYLAHVRDATAVVVAARLPPAGKSCVAHLVSVEGRYDAGSFDLGQGAQVRLVSLASWRFASVDPDQSFAGLARGLARDLGRDSDDALKLPDSGHSVADRFLRQGFVPVRRRLRDGSQDVGWYRGPLTIGPVSSGPVPPVRTADALLRYHPDVGMTDVGYATAWSLGRLLALQSADIALQIRQHRRRRRHAGQQYVGDGYPLAVTAVDDALPAGVLAWLRDLSRLRGVPFSHLIPDDRVLPAETVRFVGVDQTWVRYLLDGACGIGRLSSADADLDAADPVLPDLPTLTGALIRSDLISGYPGLIVEAYGADKKTLPAVRVEQVSRGVLLCLFEGELAQLDLRQPPTAQHFAVEEEPSGSVGKPLRPLGADKTVPASVGPFPLRPCSVVPVRELVAAMTDVLQRPVGPAEFAAQLIEVAERVTYMR